MAGLRFQIDLFIPESDTGPIVEGVKIPGALAGQLNAIRQHLRTLKSYATRINQEQVNEEDTVKAVFHICYHNEVPLKPCGKDILI